MKMNIERAINRLEWRFKNSWRPNKLDIEAYNAIIDYKELQESKSLEENELFAKLWIEKLILLNRTHLYSGERAIQVIDEILDKSVYELCLILKTELPLMRFNSIVGSKYPIKKDDALNVTIMRERAKKIAEENETELTEALKYEISEENIIKFVEQQINRIVKLKK